jgi:hypothetical protein
MPAPSPGPPTADPVATKAIAHYDTTDKIRRPVAPGARDIISQEGTRRSGGGRGRLRDRLPVGRRLRNDPRIAAKQTGLDPRDDIANVAVEFVVRSQDLPGSETTTANRHFKTYLDTALHIES